MYPKMLTMEMGWLFTVLIVVSLIFEVTQSEGDEKRVYGLLSDLDMFQGDINMTASSGFRNGILGDYTTWVNNTLPYAFLDAPGFKYTDYERRKLIRLMAEMEEELTVEGKKCIRFKPREREIGHLWFVKDSSGGTCSAKVGQPYSKLYMRIGIGCMGKGVFHHELMHALGFYHEQSRSDRDDYITINWHNMGTGAYRQFEKYPPTKVTAYGEPYDYGSLMHYGDHDFSSNGRPTITTKNGARVGQRNGMSIHDIRKIQKRYGCAVKPLPGDNVYPRPTTTVAPKGTNDFDCKFSSREWCGITRQGSEQRWTLETPDHTTGGGYAARFTVSQNEIANFDRTSHLDLMKAQANSQYCVSLWYKVDGYGEVAIKLDNKNIKGGQTTSGAWKELRATTPEESFSSAIRIFVVVKSNTYGTIHIDDVNVRKGAC